ncbi:MAG: HlyD family efflux transporter periplasmic adaptor subunit [Planctomycetota bacterium]|nr:MAG: HlyD family efflux transporter periplasmic adaptor subunit [Planctomycetota bacterium]
MNSKPALHKTSFFRWGTALLVLGIAAVTFSSWWPGVNSLVDRMLAKSQPSESGHGHDHGHDDHATSGAEVSSLELSAQAKLNLGLTAEYLRPVELSNYRKTIPIPSVIVERPGQTLIQVSTPMTGVVTQVAAIQGSAVETGQLMFRIRLTHEDLVQSQTDFVRSLGELDVENREIARLQKVTESGAIAGKSLLERQYAKEKLEALLQSQRETLRLHGLSPRQVEQISKDRRLLNELSVMVPASDQSPQELQLTDMEGRQSVLFQSPEKTSGGGDQPAAPAVGEKRPPLIVESLDVQRGQSVEQGGKLCVLADYSRLYIEGRAFEQDIEAVNSVVSKQWKVSAEFTSGTRLDNLPLSFVSSEIDPGSRTLKLYVDLPNEILHDTRNASGQRFLTWRYKPGQRLQMRIPVEEWTDQIVLPIEAVAQEGAESFVFRQSGKKFQRVAVHVIHSDQSSAVIANDGSVFPGDVIARRSAHQMQMALKNKSGGGIDPHAGHSH